MAFLYRRFSATVVVSASLFLSACTTPGKVATSEPVPTWLQTRIASYAAHKTPPVVAVHAWNYQGQTVYETLAGCCDRFNELFDAQGEYLCAPSGGFTGMGDGKCPDAAQARRAQESTVRRIWPVDDATQP
ncbi:MAG: hypothetical protein Q4G39_05585 [Brachymonas sp.]|nr:hypothetical protein [Brachymonas sp.]